MAKKNSSDYIDFKTIFRAYKKRWWWFAVSIVFFGLLGLVYIKSHNPEYSVKANVVIDSNDSNPLLRSVDFSGIFGGSANVDDEVYVLSSHSILKEVVKKLGLNEIHIVKDGLLAKQFAFPNYPVNVVAPDSLSDTLRVGLLFKVEVDKNMKASAKLLVKGDKVASISNKPLPASFPTPYGEFSIVATQSYPKGESVKSNISILGYDDAADNISKDLTIELVNRKSNVIEMAAETDNVDYGKTLLNSIISEYNQRGLSDNELQGDRTIQFIDDRIRLLASDLEQDELAIQAYKLNNNIVDVHTEAAYQTERRGELDKQLVSAETGLEILSMTRDFISDPANAYKLVPVTVQNEGQIAVISSYNNLLLQRMDLMNTAKGDNVALRNLNMQIDAMRANIINTIDKAYDNSAIRVKDLKAEMSQTSGRLSEVPSQEREYLNLKRQQAVKQQLYVFLLQRREETAMMVANSKPKAIVVDEAYVINDPVSMSNKILLAVFLFIGILIPLLLIYLLFMMRNRFDTREEVERIVDMPVLGEIAASRDDQHVIVGENGSSSASELFRLLRTNLLFILNENRDKIVLMTSTNPGEGKTYISINLAKSLSLLGKKVLLLGMDIRKPKLSHYLGLNAKYGVTQYLTSDNISIDDMIVHDPQCGDMDIIVAGPIPPNPSELLASKKVDEFFDQLRQRYDYVIVDTAPVGMVSDTFTLDRVADATIYVCRANLTSLNDLRFANSIYEQHRLKKLSLVVNGSLVRKNYGYGENR